MMEEEKLRMKEEQGSDYEDEEDEPIEEVELKKDSESSLKKSSSDGSCDSCEGEAEKSDNNNKSQPERSDDNQASDSPLEATPLRKASLSLPGSPFQRRLSGLSGMSRASNSGSHSYSLRSSGGGRKQWVRSSYLDTREQLPYADDSRVCSPAGSLDGQVISGHLTQGWPGLSSHSRQNSYSSHTSRLTYNSHAELTRGRRTNTSNPTNQWWQGRLFGWWVVFSHKYTATLSIPGCTDLTTKSYIPCHEVLPCC